MATILLESITIASMLFLAGLILSSQLNIDPIEPHGSLIDEFLQLILAIAHH